MIQRYVKVPPTIVLKNPLSGESVLDAAGAPTEITFKSFIHCLLSNPKWHDTYSNVKSSSAITTAVDEWIASGVIFLNQEDWEKLEEAAQNPKQVLIGQMGPVIVTGYGFHPSVSPQLIPFIEAVINAEAMRDENASQEMPITPAASL